MRTEEASSHAAIHLSVIFDCTEKQRIAGRLPKSDKNVPDEKDLGNGSWD